MGKNTYQTRESLFGDGTKIGQPASSGPPEFYTSFLSPNPFNLINREIWASAKEKKKTKRASDKDSSYSYEWPFKVKTKEKQTLNHFMFCVMQGKARVATVFWNNKAVHSMKESKW